MAAVATRLPVCELVALFAGCDLTDGHPTVDLGLAIIDATRPAAFGDLRRVVYGDTPPSDVPESGAALLALSWQMWVRAGGTG